jgi:hypothetical protein
MQVLLCPLLRVVITMELNVLSACGHMPRQPVLQHGPRIAATTTHTSKENLEVLEYMRSASTACESTLLPAITLVWALRGDTFMEDMDPHGPHCQAE